MPNGNNGGSSVWRGPLPHGVGPVAQAKARQPERPVSPSPPCPPWLVTVQGAQEKGQVQLMAYFKSDSLRFLSGTFKWPVPPAAWMEARCSLWMCFEKLRTL